MDLYRVVVAFSSQQKSIVLGFGRTHLRVSFSLVPIIGRFLPVSHTIVVIVKKWLLTIQKNLSKFQYVEQLSRGENPCFYRFEIIKISSYLFFLKILS